MKGIFFNSPPGQCSIYESGLMIFKALQLSKKFTIEYTECKFVPTDYDFVVFNYHDINNWMVNIISEFKCQKFCIILEVGHHNELMPKVPRIFDKYIVIDPTIKDSNNIFGFPRPIEEYEGLHINDYINGPFPIVGSFGFATPGKRWEEVVELTEEDYDGALIRINMPYGTFVPNTMLTTREAVGRIKRAVKKLDTKLEITHKYMEKNELIQWCAKNTINVFPYYRDLAGLAAVTDQAISARRPILTSDNPAFRHINKYIKPYPQISLKEAIQNNYDGALKMYEDWRQIKFCNKFEEIL